MIGLALYEEQEDVDRNVNREEKIYTFKFLEKSTLSTRKSSATPAKSLKTDEGLVQLLSEVGGQVTAGQCKLLAAWTLEFTQRLRKLKQQKQETSEEAMECEGKLCMG